MSKIKLDRASLKNMLQTQHNQLKHTQMALEAINAIDGLDQEGKVVEAALKSAKADYDKFMPEYKKAKAELNAVKQEAKDIKDKAKEDSDKLIGQANAKVTAMVANAEAKKAQAESAASQAEKYKIECEAKAQKAARELSEINAAKAALKEKL